MVYKKKSAKIEAVESITKDEVQKFAKASNKESVADQLAKLQVTLNNALGDVAAKFQETLSNHEKLVQANVLETQELERLRGIKVNADTLAELEANIESTRTRWSEEAEAIRVSREREQQEYEYERDQERKKEENAYAEKLRNRNADLSRRESELSLREDELKELRTIRDTLDEVKKKHADAQVAIVTNVLKKDFKHETDLLTAKHESEKTVLNAQVSNLRVQNDSLEETVKALRAELERARQDVKETATAALNAAGNREALNTLQNALQNQNNQGKVK